MTMAQVEFVSVFRTLFRHCRIEPALLAGKTVAEVRLRLGNVSLDSQPVVTLQMTKPHEVLLKWTRR